MKLDEDLNEYRDVTNPSAESKKSYANRSIQEQDMEEELNHEVDDQEDEEGKGKMSHDSLLFVRDIDWTLFLNLKILSTER